MINILIVTLGLVANATAAKRNAAKPPPNSWTGTIDTGKSLTSTAETAAQDADEEPDITSSSTTSSGPTGGNPDTPPTEGSAPAPSNPPSLSKSICMFEGKDEFQRRECTSEDLVFGGSLAHFAEFDGCNGASLFSDDAYPGLPGSGDCGLEHPCMSQTQAEEVLITYGSGDFCGDDKCGTNLRHPCSVEDIMMGMSPVYKSSKSSKEKLSKKLDSISKTTTDSQNGIICVFDDSLTQAPCTAKDMKQGGFLGVFAEFDGCNGATLFSDDASPGLPGSGDCGLEHPCMSQSEAEQILITYGSGDFCGDDKCGTNLRHPCEAKDIMLGMRPIYKSTHETAEFFTQESSSFSMPYSMLAGVAASVLLVAVAFNAVIKRRGMTYATATPAYAAL